MYHLIWSLFIASLVVTGSAVAQDESRREADNGSIERRVQDLSAPARSPATQRPDRPDALPATGPLSAQDQRSGAAKIRPGLVGAARANRLRPGSMNRGREPAVRTGRARLSDAVRLTAAERDIRSTALARRLRAIAEKKSDPEYIGVIDQMFVDGETIALERRPVATDNGVMPLLMIRIGTEYVYDGDMIVPPLALLAGEQQVLTRGSPGVAFAAAPTGPFGAGPLWDDAIIPFDVAPGFCCDAALEAAIADYHARTIFRFVPRDGHPTYVHFTNSEPFLSSRTMLGKQPGQNTVKIQGFRSDGSPRSEVSRTSTIQHEIGHELGLIHEHTRADRDSFISRNPNCTPGNLFQAIVESWIDATNAAPVNTAAELLTDYDFASLMHYSFLLDNTGDGVPDCTTWVRNDTCPDPTAGGAACFATFSSTSLTALDIEGLHTLYSLVSVDPPNASGTIDQRIFTGENVRHRGGRIDRCLHGPVAGDHCSPQSRQRVADEFCQTQGYTSGANIQFETAIGTHSGFDIVQGWVNVLGSDVIRAVTCSDLTTTAADVLAGALEERIFTGNDLTIDNLAIDRCVWGTTGFSGDRCSESNQLLVADAFCRMQEFDRATLFETNFGPGPSVGYAPANDQFSSATSVDIFWSVTCARTP